MTAAAHEDKISADEVSPRDGISKGSSLNVWIKDLLGMTLSRVLCLLSLYISSG